MNNSNHKWFIYIFCTRIHVKWCISEFSNQFNSILQSYSRQASKQATFQKLNFQILWICTNEPERKVFLLNAIEKKQKSIFLLLIYIRWDTIFFWVLQIKWEYIGFTYCVFCIVACCALDAQPVLLSLVKYGCSRFALTRFNQKQYNSIQCYLKLNRKFTGCYRCYRYCCNDEHARNTHMWILQLSSLLIYTL